MNRYHVAHKTDFDFGTLTKGDWFTLAAVDASFSLEVAMKFAAEMNKTVGVYGSYFPVPAPFAGEM